MDSCKGKGTAIFPLIFLRQIYLHIEQNIFLLYINTYHLLAFDANEPLRMERYQTT